MVFQTRYSYPGCWPKFIPSSTKATRTGQPAPIESREIQKYVCVCNRRRRHSECGSGNVRQFYAWDLVLLANELPSNDFGPCSNPLSLFQNLVVVRKIENLKKSSLLLCMYRCSMLNTMRSISLVSLLLGPVAANIIFNHVELSCDPNNKVYTGCLRGQHCGNDRMWVVLRFFSQG